jgi:hypothetical protein
MQSERDLSAADHAILDNDMRLSKVDDTIYPVSAALASADVETLKGVEPTKLTPAEHERLIVLSAMNEAEAKILYGTTARVIPQQVMELTTLKAAMAAQAAADPMGANQILHPPKAEMSLEEMFNWLVTTPAFQRGGEGQGSGKEAAFQAAAQTYQEWGKELFLELEPGIGARHAQGMIQQRIQRYAPEDRERMRLIYDQQAVGTRPAMRQTMGLPPLPVGAP